MPLNQAKVEAIHEEVRRYFKGQLKSGKKMYDEDFKGTGLDHKPPRQFSGQPKYVHWKIVPDAKQRDVRNDNRVLANAQVRVLRKTFASIRGDDPLMFGYFILDQVQQVANCHDAAAAAAFVPYIRGIKAVWIGNIGNEHGFCIVSEGAEPTGDSVNGLMFDSSGAWIIDPWANVCCPARLYYAHFTVRMRQWSQRGSLYRSWRKMDFLHNTSTPPHPSI